MITIKLDLVAVACMIAAMWLSWLALRLDDRESLRFRLLFGASLAIYGIVGGKVAEDLTRPAPAVETCQVEVADSIAVVLHGPCKLSDWKITDQIPEGYTKGGCADYHQWEYQVAWQPKENPRSYR